MDTSVIALAASYAKLNHLRISKVDAQILSDGGMSGGKLQIATKSALKRNNSVDTEYLIDVTIECVGLTKETDKPAFRIAVTAEGFYQFAVAPATEVSRDPLFVNTLDQRVYVAAMMELHSIARAMGLGGVRLPAELDKSAAQFHMSKASKHVAATKKVGTSKQQEAQRTRRTRVAKT